MRTRSLPRDRSSTPARAAEAGRSSTSRPVDSRDPHHGHTGSCKTPPTKRSYAPRLGDLAARPPRTCSATPTTRPTARSGTASCPTGCNPPRPAPAAAISHAHSRAAARWNCCAVSSRSVYRISTATPCVPSIASGVPGSSTPCSRRMANVYAASPRYASVLPPPVGKNSSWTSASSGSPSPRCASACDGDR